MSVRLLTGDARAVLPTLEPESVQLCLTSPPYMGLRSYIADGDPLKPFEIGLEPTPDMFVEHLVEVFRHVRRVLRPDGVLVVNMGDSYAGSGKGPSESLQPLASQMQRVGPQPHTIGLGRQSGYKPKDLMMMPARVAMALQADGWYLRSMIPWLKRSAMPESVRDRPATSVEYLFLLSRERTYYWDADAIRVPQREFIAKGNGAKSVNDGTSLDSGAFSKRGGFNAYREQNGVAYNPLGRTRKNGDWFFETWQGLLLDEQNDPLALVVNPAPLKAAHFAAFPPKLVEPFIKAATRPGGWVLDPFGGAGTCALVADRLGRNAISIDLKPDYVEMQTERVTQDAPLFVELSA